MGQKCRNRCHTPSWTDLQSSRRWCLISSCARESYSAARTRTARLLLPRAQKTCDAASPTFRFETVLGLLCVVCASVASARCGYSSTRAREDFAHVEPSAWPGLWGEITQVFFVPALLRDGRICLTSCSDYLLTPAIPTSCSSNSTSAARQCAG